MIGKLKYFFFQIIHNSFVKEKSINKYCFCFCLRVLYGEILLCLSVYNINISNTCIIMKKKHKNCHCDHFQQLYFQKILFLYEMGKIILKKNVYIVNWVYFALPFIFSFSSKSVFFLSINFIFCLVYFFLFGGRGNGGERYVILFLSVIFYQFDC